MIMSREESFSDQGLSVGLIPQQPKNMHEGMADESQKLIVLMPGAFHTGKTFSTLQPELEVYDYDTMAITFNNDDPAATAESDAQMVADKIGDRRGVILVGWSRAIEKIVYLPQMLDPNQLEGVVAYGTGGPQKYLLPMESVLDTSIPRYKPGYDQYLQQRPDGRYEITPDAARHYFYHDLTEELVDKALSELVPQTENTTPGAVQPWSPDMPTLLLLGRGDRVLDVARAQAIGHKFFHVNTEIMPGGHSLHLSHAQQLAERIVQFVTDEVTTR